MGEMVVQFFGVRGTLPVPGKQTVRYGGNTNCITVTIEDRYFFIFDAGTGIKALSDYLQAEHPGPIDAKIFITHPHYDHINGIPYFAPLYEKGNHFEFLGPDHGHHTLQNLISKQMDSIYFPVTVEEFSSELSFRSLGEETIHFDDVIVRSMYLNHPGKCLGYRVEYDGKAFCYITDNELFLESSPKYNAREVEHLVQFIYHADMVVMDATYTDEEYLEKINWGHACISRVVDVADRAEVKLLCLHHHSPGQVDKDIDAKLKAARKELRRRRSKTHCIAPAEGDQYVLCVSPD